MLGKQSIGKRITSFPQFGILVVFIGLIIILCIASPASFMTGDNFISVLRQAAAQMVVAIGMTFVLILGGIDLSGRFRSKPLRYAFRGLYCQSRHGYGAVDCTLHCS